MDPLFAITHSIVLDSGDNDSPLLLPSPRNAQRYSTINIFNPELELSDYTLPLTPKDKYTLQKGLQSSPFNPSRIKSTHNLRQINATFNSFALDKTLTKYDQKALSLDKSLHMMQKKIRNQPKKMQVKYLGTLIKVKSQGQKMNCQVNLKSSGIQIKLKEKQQKKQDHHQYMLKKEFNRYFRKKILSNINHCSKEVQSFQLMLGKDQQRIIDTIKSVKESSSKTKEYPLTKLEKYFKIQSTKKKQYPFFIKKQLERKFNQPQHTTKHRQSKGKYEQSPSDSPDTSMSHWMHRDQSPNSTLHPKSSRWTQLLSLYQHDITEFIQICKFLQRVQHQLLRYLPNNHLSNKIGSILQHIEHGNQVKKIYEQSNKDVTVFTPRIIIKILKKNQGVLGIMNYLVNIIKLKISAERRKRFKQREKTIVQYQGFIKESSLIVCENLKTTNSAEMKGNICSSLRGIDNRCLGLNPNYTEFVKEAEHQEFSEAKAYKNRQTICEILKYESLMT